MRLGLCLAKALCTLTLSVTSAGCNPEVLLPVVSPPFTGSGINSWLL